MRLLAPCRLFWVPTAFVGAHTALVLFLAAEQLASPGRKGVLIPVDVLDLPCHWAAYYLGLGGPFDSAGSHEEWVWNAARWYALLGGVQWCAAGAGVALYLEWAARKPSSGRGEAGASASEFGAARFGWAVTTLVSLVAICFLWLYSVPRAKEALGQERSRDLEDSLQWLAELRDAYAEEHAGTWPSSLPEFCGVDGYLPTDPWGREFLLVPPEVPGARPTIVTLGRDGLPGGDGPDADTRR